MICSTSSCHSVAANVRKRDNGTNRSKGRIPHKSDRRVLEACPFAKSAFIGQDHGSASGGGFAQVYGEAHDHKVASGGHKNDAVRLFRNFDKEVKDKTNVAPSIPELFDVDWKKICLDVRIIRLGRVHS